MRGSRVAISGVYSIVHLETGKAYFGSSSNIPARIQKHIQSLNTRKHSNQGLQRDWDRYGRSAFEAQIVGFVCDQQLRMEMEKKVIAAQDKAMIYNVIHATGPVPIRHGCVGATAIETNDMLTIPDLVKLCKVSRQTVYNWIDNGTAPRHERIGGRYFFYRDDAELKKKDIRK